MAKSTYRTTFADGSHVDVVAETADLAKATAKNARIGELDPGRSMQTADLRRHSRVQVASVRELTDADRPTPTGAGIASRDTDIPAATGTDAGPASASTGTPAPPTAQPT